jgi:hypothetical protein
VFELGPSKGRSSTAPKDSLVSVFDFNPQLLEGLAKAGIIIKALPIIYDLHSYYLKLALLLGKSDRTLAPSKNEGVFLFFANLYLKIINQVKG